MYMLSSVLLLGTLASLVRGDGAPVVDLGYAKFSGYQNTSSGLNQYHGIYYAEPPVGELRWRKARPIEPYMTPGQTIDASQIGPSCWNGVPSWRAHTAVTIAPGTNSSSENCLLLDVFTPMNPDGPSLPVLVEIHGGGYTQGSAQSPRPDSIMWRANGSFVWVSIQYRLGMFGFLAGRDIYDNGGSECWPVGSTCRFGVGATTHCCFRWRSDKSHYHRKFRRRRYAPYPSVLVTTSLALHV